MTLPLIYSLIHSVLVDFFIKIFLKQITIANAALLDIVSALFCKTNLCLKNKTHIKFI